jgi:signal transduction histidine kinase
MTISADCDVRNPLVDESAGESAPGWSPSAQGPETRRYEAVADYLHDLRTPLVALRGYAKMLQEERVGQLNALQKNYIQVIVENSQRLVRVLNELSQIAAMEPMAFEKLNVRSLFEGVLASSEQRHSRLSVHLDVACELESSYISGDPHHLAEAFDDLLQTVIDASPSEDRIAVVLSRLGNQIHVAISNCARAANEGVEQSTATATKAKFWRSSARSPLEHLAGISIAEAVIILHGGHFISESPDNQIMRFVLPAYVPNLATEKESQ